MNNNLANTEIADKGNDPPSAKQKRQAEDTIYHLAKREGFKLEKCRNKQDEAYGTFRLRDHKTNIVVLSKSADGYGMSLDEVESYLLSLAALKDERAQDAHGRSPRISAEALREVQRECAHQIRAMGAKNIAQVMSDALYLEIPPNNVYMEFIRVYGERLRADFPQYPLIIRPQLFSSAILTPEVYFPQTFSRTKPVLMMESDNESFLLNDGANPMVSITFRPFGPLTVQLSTIFVVDSYRNKQLGTKFLTLAQEVAREVKARLVLYPAPSGVESVEDRPQAALRLRKWYARLGFVTGHPEFFHGLRVANGEAILFGLGRYMFYR